MSTVDYVKDPGEKIATVTFTGTVHSEDISTYFTRVLDEIQEGEEYREIVDFSNVEGFTFGSHEFMQCSELIVRAYHTKRYVHTRFLVKNRFQYGMAHMFIMLTGESVDKFDIDHLE